MRGNHISAILLGLLVAAGASGEDFQVFEAEPPETHDEAVEPVDPRDPVPVGQPEPPIARSRSTGSPVVSIPLDDTGVADWRFLNPRRPRVVPLDHDIEFVNGTDRTFEVTTKVALPPASLVPSELPTSVPLLIYDALLALREPPAERPAMRVGESTADYEARLIGDARSRRPDIAPILDDVVALDTALRVRSEARAKVTKAAGALVEMSRAAGLTEIGTAQRAHELSLQELQAAETLVATHTGSSDSLAKRRAPLVDELRRKAVEIRRARPPAREGHALLLAAAQALEEQGDETALLSKLRRALPGVRLDSCKVAASVTCSLSLQVSPGLTAELPHAVLTNQADPTSPAALTVNFFEATDTPARQVAYLVSKRYETTVGAPKSSSAISAVASVGYSLDPFVRDLGADSKNCPRLCPDRPFEGEERSHFPGSGSMEVSQSYGNLWDGKVKLGFKEGDLGGAASTIDVKLSQFRFNVYSKTGLSLHFGRYTFAAPSSGIALSETGDGFRLAWRFLALTHLLKRESAASVADSEDRDHSALLFETGALRIPGNTPLRTGSLLYLHGEDRKGREEVPHPTTKIKEAFFTEHDYSTLGGHFTFAFPGVLYGSLGAYRSERDADESGAPCHDARHVCDGRGEVALLTLTHAFSFNDVGKAERTVSLALGQGSGDDPRTSTIDESYVGETASYAPDQIFLSSLASGVSTREFVDIHLDQFSDPSNADRDRERKEEFHRLDAGALGIGRGLANKRHASLQLVDDTWSLIGALMKQVGWPEDDITSQSTVITFHDYRLREALAGEHHAGNELDIEFRIETPKSVRVTLKGGYYRPGAALKQIVPSDVWSVASTVTLSL